MILNKAETKVKLIEPKLREAEEVGWIKEDIEREYKIYVKGEEYEIIKAKE